METEALAYATAALSKPIVRKDGTLSRMWPQRHR